MCKIIFCVVKKRVFAMTSVFSWQNSDNFCPDSTSSPTFLLLQVYLEFLLFHSSPPCWILLLFSHFSHVRLCVDLWTSVYGILQARVLEWLAMLSSRGSSQPGMDPGLLHCMQILYHWATREAQWWIKYFYVLVLAGLLGLHRTEQLQLLWQRW